MVLTSKSFSVERNFEEVAKTSDEKYLLDFASVKSGDNGEIKYIVLISFAKPQKLTNGDKYLSTQFLLNMHSVKRFPSIILRFFLVYGHKQDQNRILPIVIENCLRDKKFPTTKGDQYCDFCHINDAIKAIFKSLLLKSINGEIINIGSGKPIQIKKVIKLVKNLIGKGKPQIGKLQYKIGTNKKLYPSIIKAKKKINWKPSITFEKGLKETITNFYER